MGKILLTIFPQNLRKEKRFLHSLCAPLVQLIGNERLFAPHICKINLVLAFAKTGAVGVGIFARAMMTGGPPLIFRPRFIGGGNRAAAGVAGVVIARRQPIILKLELLLLVLT
jgi:hypothetical protein